MVIPFAGCSWIHALLFVVVLSLPLQAADTPSTAVITNLAGIWEVSVEEEQDPVALDIQAVVLTYDSVWQVLWIIDSTRSVYLDTGGVSLPIKAGQRIRFRGVTVAGENLVDWKNTEIEVLEEDALSEAQPLTVPMGEAASLNSLRVKVEGYVRAQTEVDHTHLLLELVTEHSTYTVYVIIPQNAPVPQYADCRVTVTGLLSLTIGPLGRPAEGYLWANSPRDVGVINRVADDPSFLEPLSAMSDLPTLGTNRQVRVRGGIVAVDPGRTVTLRDDAGQVVVESWQLQLPQVGALVEATGKLKKIGA